MTDQKPLSPIQLPNVSDVVYEILRKQILDSKFMPGEQLNLRELELQLDVSRTPLKAALARLQVDGLVSVHPRRGTYVTRFTGRDIEESFELRIALEAQALRHAFKPHNQARVQELIRLFGEMNTYFRDEATWLDQIPDFMDLDRIAHLQMISLSDNSRLQEAYERANVQGFIAVMGARFFYQDTLRTQEEHRRIADALRAGDLPALLDAARTHLEQAGARALRRLSERDGA